MKTFIKQALFKQIILKKVCPFVIIVLRIMKGGKFMKKDRLICFLQSERVRTIITKTDFLPSTITKAEYVSDFECYSALCRGISFFALHPIREEFLRLLSDRADFLIDPCDLVDDEYIGALWHRSFYRKGNMPSKSLATEKTVRFSEIIKKDDCFSLNDAYNTNYGSIFELLSAILDAMSFSESRIVVFDATEIDFFRPDDFHAEEEYRKAKINSQCASMVYLWLICRVLMNTKSELYLKVDTAKKTEQILKLIFSLKLSPKIYIAFDIKAQQEHEKIFELYLANCKKNISLEPYATKEISVCELSGYLKDMLKIIPLALIASASYTRGPVFKQAISTVFDGACADSERKRVLNSLQ